MRYLTRATFNIIAASLLLGFAIPGHALTVCDFLAGFSDLAASGETARHKTDYEDPVSGCIIQARVKIQNGDPNNERVEFAIERSCPGTGLAQFQGTFRDRSGATKCTASYDNPDDPTPVDGTTDIATVPGLQQLLQDASAATEAQSFLAQALVDKLDAAAPPTACKCDLIALGAGHSDVTFSSVENVLGPVVPFVFANGVSWEFADVGNQIIPAGYDPVMSFQVLFSPAVCTIANSIVSANIHRAQFDVSQVPLTTGELNDCLTAWGAP